MEKTMKAVIETTCSTEAEQKLFRAVVRQFGDWEELFDRPEDFRNASYGVNGFICYSETEPFAKKKYG